MVEPSALDWHRSVTRVLEASHIADPAEVVDVVDEAMADTGVGVAVYLADREQKALRALPRRHVPTPAPLQISGTVAGRAFMLVRLTVPPDATDRLWVPILDGSDRLGVTEIRLPTGVSAQDPQVQEGAERLTSAIGYVVVAKGAYGDTVRRSRRSQPMAVGGELLWRALPPLTLATPQFSLAAALEPCYEVGGDAFDYAADHHVLRAAIFDAIGHGLWAALTSTLTLGATRAARATGADLTGHAATADAALTSQFGDARYTTGVLSEIDGTTGTVRYLNAGHPPPVVMRGGKAVDELGAAPRPPLGLGSSQGIGTRPEVATHQLEPGDRLLFYTDGVTEARDADGHFFGVPRLIAHAEQHAASGLAAPEVVRRLTHAILRHQDASLQDDATLMIVEWSPPSTEKY